MILFSNAKINIGLRVLSKRTDGYHNIETIMMPVDFSDLLEFIENKENKASFESSGIKLDCNDEENMVLKALNLLRRDFEIPHLKIHLHKFIPPGAGLGGGSSNGAFMLKGLNDYFKLGIDEHQLERYAASLGSDCPMFIRNVPCLAEGRGEVLTRIQFMHSYHLVLIYPGFAVSTREAYAGIIPGKEDIPLVEIIKTDPVEWKDLIVNHFEKIVFEKYPVLKSIKLSLYNSGAVYASMSGSGSVIYGLFREKPCLDKKLLKVKVWEGMAGMNK